ncbi:MAG: M20 family metallopeptidase [Clostridiales bacterium]|nr:M20 family metallopeptidase [Clostridiales bacterium]
MNDFLLRAGELEAKLIENRRYFHENAEYGLELPKTKAFLLKKLNEYGYSSPKEVGEGIVCTVGTGTPVFLLRADMDALKQEEKSGLPFACREGACHSCGHDAHTAMLLCAAKLLKERESELQGTIKLMFQPGEEGHDGAEKMIASGLLKDPSVDAAMTMHCTPLDVGSVEYCLGSSRASITFRIVIHGLAAHGATPEDGVSALSVAAMIVTAAQQLPSMEVSSKESAVLSFGHLDAGTAANIIPEKAVLEGTIRVFDNKLGDRLTERLREIAEHIAAAHRATAEFSSHVIPGFKNSEDVCLSLLPHIEEICGKDNVTLYPGDIPVTDDFACVGLEVPAMMFNIGMQSGPVRRAPHDPAMNIDESGLKYGAALYANCAMNWLREH